MGLVDREQHNYSNFSRTVFVGIGINEYNHFPRLENAERDVEDIACLLTRRFGVDESYILKSKEATKEGVLRILTNVADRLTDKDNLIFYYAGHGSPGRNGKGFWLPKDAHPDEEGSRLRNATIIDMLDDISMRHLVLFCDSCFSGTLIESGIYRSISDSHNQVLNTLKSRWVICSGGSDQVVQDGTPGRNSPFATALLEILSDPLLKEIRVGSLVEELRMRTANRYRQVLRSGQLIKLGDEGGQFVFRVGGKEEQLWLNSLEKNTFSAFQAYLIQYPDGVHAETAKRLCHELLSTREYSLPATSNLLLPKVKIIRYAESNWLVNESLIKPLYTWKESWELSNRDQIIPTAQSLGSLRTFFHDGSTEEIEKLFAFTYPGYIDQDGRTRGKDQLQCFWTSNVGKSGQAFAYIFNRELGRVYEKELHQECSLSLLLLKTT